MSAILEVVNRHLPAYRQSRTKFCGAKMPTMIRDDGSRIDGAVYRCGDRFCGFCARCRSQRVYACILRAISDSAMIAPAEAKTGVMVTLTQQKPPGHTGKDLRAARDIQQKIQAEAHKRLNRHDYAVQRIARHTARSNWRKVAEWVDAAKKALPLFDHSDLKGQLPLPTNNPFCGYAHASGGKTTYIWAREITPGGSGARYNGWHVHSHYLVPTIDDAYRLISAHLAACRSLGVKALAREQVISFPEPPEKENGADGGSVSDAARYITQYITKSGLDDVDESLIEAYIYGIHGLRQYDAAGRWRPLGIGKKRDESKPCVTHVEEIKIAISSDGELVERAMLEPFVDFMQQKTTWWTAQRAIAAKRPLDQYRTNLTDMNLADELKKIAARRVVDGDNLWFDGLFMAESPQI